MRVEDAPPAGWYPDPEGGSRLRWWEGTDWSDRYRAPPTPGVVERREGHEPEVQIGGVPQPPTYVSTGGMSRQDTEAIIAQVRAAAREEVHHAAQMFGHQARAATREIGPMITQYTTRFTRWIRYAAILTVIVLIAWLAFQVFAQVSLFEWIGDRIDNITDDEGGAGTQVLRR